MSIALHLLGAVAVFLLGLDLLSDAFGAVPAERVQASLGRWSRTPLRALLAGIVATAVLDSSSAVIVILVALVNAHRLSAGNALGIVLGANIGTTVGSQVIALDIGWLAPMLLIVGVGGRLFVRSPSARVGLGIAQGRGLLFTCLELMDQAVHPLRDDPRALGWIERLADPVQGAATGGLVTLLIQSSSATVGIAIGLAKSGILSLQAGVAVMLGAEIGTCADTLIAGIGRTRAALRVGVFHLAFNIVSVIAGLLLIVPITDAAVGLSPGGDVGRHLANAHVLFDTGGALLALPFVGWAAAVLEAWIPDRAEQAERSPLLDG